MERRKYLNNKQRLFNRMYDRKLLFQYGYLQYMIILCSDKSTEDELTVFKKKLSDLDAITPTEYILFEGDTHANKWVHDFKWKYRCFEEIVDYAHLNFKQWKMYISWLGEVFLEFDGKFAVIFALKGLGSVTYQDMIHNHNSIRYVVREIVTNPDLVEKAGKMTGYDIRSIPKVHPDGTVVMPNEETIVPRHMYSVCPCKSGIWGREVNSGAFKKGHT